MNMLFSAIGVLAGNITQQDDKLFVSVQDKQYPLLYNARRKQQWHLLNQLLKNNSTATSYTIAVYPKIVHSNDPNKIYNVSFTLVKFKPEEYSSPVSGILQTLQPNEFNLFGLWQFIGQCQTPVISVYRNLNKHYLQKIKQTVPEKKFQYTRPSHIPLIWENRPVQPIKLSSKKHPYFVQLKAKFNPTTDIFEFDTLLSEPTRECPEYFQPNHKKAKLKEESKSNHEEHSASTAA